MEEEPSSSQQTATSDSSPSSTMSTAALQPSHFHPPPPFKTKDRTEPDNGSPKTKLDLKTESGRLKTFINWPNAAIAPLRLAQAGFYYFNHDDAVRCAFCETEGCQWEATDDPLEDHRKWSPNCSFVRSRPSTSSSGVEDPVDYDVCGNLPSRSLPEKETLELLRKLGVETARAPNYEDYTTYDSRFKSYEDWPKSLKQKPVKLAEAGFFYKGLGDQTLCFHCGGGLKDWEDNDDPWEQHALWFPKCQFLVLSKGKDYVEEIKLKYRPELAASSPPKTKEEPVKVEEESKDDSSTLCKICYKNEVQVIFLPCGHVVSCVDCSLSLKNICPLCRKRFETTIRAFLS